MRRRRACGSCGVRFTTYERPVWGEFLVEKRDGRIEPFAREKLLRGLRKALEKRPVPDGTPERLAAEMEDALRALGRPVVASSVIGEQVCERLIGIDEVAYLRFASVYKEFTDAAEFARELQLLQSKR